MQALPTAFDPSNPTLTSGNSALLPFDKVTGYIDDALLALGLHTEARTSFITSVFLAGVYHALIIESLVRYWLPDLQKHKYLVLRFLPQSEYEAAAPMNVTPAPDVTTRVFMLFKGVDESELQSWESARAKAEDPSVWRDVVGVDVDKAADVGLFRVLEWGGVEVK
jgi:hypothetical protein